MFFSRPIDDSKPADGLAWRADCSNSFLRESFHFYLNGLDFVW